MDGEFSYFIRQLCNFSAGKAWAVKTRDQSSPVVVSGAVAVVMPLAQIFSELLLASGLQCLLMHRQQHGARPALWVYLYLSSLLCLMAAGSTPKIPRFRLRITGGQSLSIGAIILFHLTEQLVLRCDSGLLPFPTASNCVDTVTWNPTA